MRLSPKPDRAASPLSAALHKNLNAYAVGATAAGVALLAATQPANAEVVFTPANHRIANDQRLNLDLNHDGVVDFQLINELFLSTTPFGDNLSVRPAAAGNAVCGGKADHGYFAAALPAGLAINSKTPFQERQLNLAFASLTAFTYVSGGPWKSARNRFLGLKFLIDGEVHFGWARLTVMANKQKEEVTAILTGYAYETEANTPIVTGQTKGASEAVSRADPIPASKPTMLGWLALGSPGLSAWRRERNGFNAC
jgi:hypothetical protein